MEPPAGPQAQPKPKMSYACEACRAAKVKCQSGSQPGICKRCSEFKRECVFRTGPRTRRPKGSSSRPSAQAPPPPPGPSQTFSIDFSMPAAEELALDFNHLRLKHENYLEDLVPSSGEDYDDVLGDVRGSNRNANTRETFDFSDLSSGAIPTPSSTVSASSGKRGVAASGDSRPMRNLGLKPQFNLDLATRLLSSFEAMLPHCPCMVLPANGGADVPSMARDAPFVLLAILAVTSCSSSLQSHSLYDDEFRKVLGLKFVAGGERSLELLQGLLIYCSWYPFHLRPKNRRMFQYLRMAVDIVRDLELDEESDITDLNQDPETRETKLQSIRAFLGCYYSASMSGWAWSKRSELRYTLWTAKCCDALEQSSDLDQDHALVWLVRLQYIVDEISEVQRNFTGFRDQQSEHHQQLIRIGLETQLRDFQGRIPTKLSTTPSIYMGSLTADMYLVAAPLMRTHRPSSVSSTTSRTPNDPAIDPTQLLAAASQARAFLSYAASLPRRQMSRFCAADWARFVVAVILGLRLSFPAAPECPGYDHVAGRAVIGFGVRLRELCASAAGEEEDDNARGQGGEEGGGTDVVAAMRVVLGSVKEKFDRKMAAEAAEQKSARAQKGACPMLDGSLDQYLPVWDGQQQQQQYQGHGSYPLSAPSATSRNQFSGGYGSGSSSSSNTSGMPTNLNLPGFVGASADPGDTGGALNITASGGAAGEGPIVFHDLWAAMTMGWAAEEIGGGGGGLEGVDWEGDPGYADCVDLGIRYS